MQKKIKFTFLCLLLFAFQFAYSLSNFKLDSLLTELKVVNDVTQKGKILDKIVDVYFWNDRDKATLYINHLLRHGKKNSDYYSLHRAYFYKAIALKPKANKDSVFIYLKKAIEYGKREKSVEHICDGTIKLADYYVFYNQHSKAKQILSEALSLSKKSNNITYTCRTLNAIGKIYQNKKMPAQAFKYFIEVDGILSKTNGDKNSWAENKMNIGDLYRTMNLPIQARKSYTEALHLFTKIENGIGIMHAKKSIGILYLEEKQFDKAEQNFNEVYNFYKNHEFRSNFANISNLIGKLYIEKKLYSDANIKLNEALKVYREINHSFGEIETLIDVSLLDEKSNSYQAAKTNLESALKISKKNKITNFEGLIYLKLAKIHDKLNDKNSAIHFYNQHSKITDSISKINQNQEIFELEMKNINDKKELELAAIASKNQLQIYLISGVLILLLSLGLLYFLSVKNKIKTARKIQELNELKSKFFANISHEFRTPLTLIKSPIQSLKLEEKVHSKQVKLELIERNSDRMLELVDQLLELSKIDSGHLKLILKEGNCANFLSSLVEAFEFQAIEKRLLFTTQIKKNTDNHYYDKDIIEKIVTNLLSNAIKYTPENEQIEFSTEITNNQLVIIVCNSGSSIKQEEVSKLFERFYQVNENFSGAGIGLALVKELVELYKGKITTTINNGKLCFTVLLPLEKVNEKAVIINKSDFKIAESDRINTDELPILLVVDDNDEIRQILIEIFQKEYLILEANNGREGIKIAQKEIPDCIISDVMMPKMDGFEFTKNIKNNELTSFIPIVLLTAKVGDENHLRGLMSAADAYLTKPFNNQIVQQTVKQLLSERKKLQEKFSQELVLKPVDVVISSYEEKFLLKIQEILKINLSNSDFTAEDFAQEIGMTKMQLYRKLKSLFGQSANEFIRNERLKSAAEQLQIKSANVSEIAYSVGFNDMSYFAKCFKEKYNCTPSEYSQKA